MVKILIEKVRDDSPFSGALSAGDVVEMETPGPLMRDGVVFCVAPAEAVVNAPPPNISDGSEPGALLAILDQPIREVGAALDGLSVAALRHLLDAERAGKTRKGVVELLTAAITASSG